MHRSFRLAKASSNIMISAVYRTNAKSSMGKSGKATKHLKLRSNPNVRDAFNDYSDDELYSFSDFLGHPRTLSNAHYASSFGTSPPQRSMHVSSSLQPSKKPRCTEQMKPRNKNQEKYIQLLEQEDPAIVISSGPAGTGKSSIAVSVGIQQLLNGKFERIVITRPAVTVEEEHGFLPGSLEDKMDPWMRPLYDTFYKYYSPDQVKAMISNKVIDICPLAYLRGRTLEDCFIIIDESQNCSVKQMLMVLTRIGKNSKMVITGDPMQHDRGFEKNGLTDLVERVHRNGGIRGIAQIVFDEQDVERHPVIKQVLELYK